MNSRPEGFTLIELMMVVAVMAILAVIAAPSLRDIIMNARMTSAANDLHTDLSVARAEAVKRGSPTAVCTSNDGATCTNSAWSLGWIIFADPDGNGVVAAATDVLKIVPAIGGANDIPPNTIVSANHATNANSASYVGFRPSGVVTAGGVGAAITFDLCDARMGGTAAARNKGRRINVARTGRAFVVRCTCPDATECTPDPLIP